MPEPTLYAVTDPATGQTLATYPTATEADIDTALASAHAATSWGRSSAVAQRAKLLREVAYLHRKRRADLAATIVQEMGKPLEEAETEIDFCADIYDYYADNAEAFLADEPVDIGTGRGSAVLRRSPVGALLGIMPWNFPAYQIARFAAPNLAAGNTVILKPAPQCPASADALQQIFHDAGFPAGAYGTVYATNDQVARVIADPRVQGVSLTGSEAAGSAVAQIAGRHLKKVVLELGGSDPFLVLSTEDMADTVDKAVTARLDNTGQVCNAPKRFIVLEELYQEFLDAFTEQLLARSPANPLASQAAADALAERVETAVAQGATYVTAGARTGAHFPAGVLTDLSADHDIVQQELFGPVAMVFRARDEDHAVQIANDTPYGLGSYIISTDPQQARRVADRIDAGMVFVNGVLADQAELPFGGVKRSGFGRELGRPGIEEFLNKKLIRTVTA